MIKRIKRYKKNYKFYIDELSNFRTVFKDTNNKILTTPQEDYNCMSYAFNVFNDWLCIDAFHSSYTQRSYGAIDYDYLEDIFEECCIELEERFTIRRLSGPTSEIYENERMIAFRIGMDDFHFARRNSDGIWTHKPGAWTIREMSEEELLSDAWSIDRKYPYVSSIAFFAVAA